jgi:hypothetical protein
MDLNASSLFANIVVGALGFGIFLYGKKERRPPQFVAGILLMVFPYFVDGAIPIFAVAAGIVAALWFAVRRGF